MAPRTFVRVVVVGFGSLLLPLVVRAADPPPQPDLELLEFLGSEDDDPTLQDYVAHQDTTHQSVASPAPHRGEQSA